MTNNFFYKLFGLILILSFFSCNKEDLSEEEIIKPFLRGTVDTTLTVNSSILDTLIHYSVYLPPNYETSEVDYPVLYLLHGMTEDHRTWVNMSMKDVMDLYINGDQSKPMIVVMPQAFNSFYINDEENEGGLYYEDFLINEFFPYVQSNYRIKIEKNNTSIAGNSMGGFGATYISFKYNERFGSSYSMGGALFKDQLSEVIEGKTQAQLANLPDFVMEVGTEDFITFGFNEEFDAYLTQKNIDHIYKKRTGGHTGWIDMLPSALKVAGKHFD